MTITRADINTARKEQTEFYSDLTVDLAHHPVTYELTRLTNENAVKRSIKNILLTNRGERLFNRDFGGDLTRLLFEPMSDMTAISIKQSILDSITTHEPRVRISDIEVIANEEQNSYRVNIYFMIVNQKNLVGMTVFLQRVR